MGELEFVDAGGVRARVRLVGDPAAAPVVLIHGIGRSLEDWGRQYDLLAEGHRLIGVDLPGFGLSERRPGTATIAGLADGVLATLDALGERRPVNLIGNSLGGGVSLRILGAAPERVASLVLVNSAGFGREVTYLLRMLAIPGLGKQMLRRPSRFSTRHTERALFATKSLATPERIEHALTMSRTPGTSETLAEIALGLGTIRGARSDWRDELLAAAAAHPRPMLIVWGDRDKILPPQHLDAARAAFPQARTHLFQRTGHMPMIERPEEFAALVREFLAGAS